MSGNPQEIPRGIGCSLTLLFISAVWFAVEFLTSAVQWASRSFFNSLLMGLSTLLLIYITTKTYQAYKKGKIKRIYLRSASTLKKSVPKLSNISLLDSKYITINTKVILSSLIVIAIISLPAIKALSEEDKWDKKEEQIDLHNELNNRDIDYNFTSMESFEERFRKDCTQVSEFDRTNCDFFPSIVKVSGKIRYIDRHNCDIIGVCLDDGQMQSGDDFKMTIRFSFGNYFKLFGDYKSKNATVICNLQSRLFGFEETDRDIVIDANECSIDDS